MLAPQTDKINIAHDGSEHPTAAHKNTMQLERFLTLDLLAGIPLS